MAVCYLSFGAMCTACCAIKLLLLLPCRRPWLHCALPALKNQAASVAAAPPPLAACCCASCIFCCSTDSTVISCCTFSCCTCTEGERNPELGGFWYCWSLPSSTEMSCPENQSHHIAEPAAATVLEERCAAELICSSGLHRQTSRSTLKPEPDLRYLLQVVRHLGDLALAVVDAPLQRLLRGSKNALLSKSKNKVFFNVMQQEAICSSSSLSATRAQADIRLGTAQA